jgi:hypothetical protein
MFRKKKEVVEQRKMYLTNGMICKEKERAFHMKKTQDLLNKNTSVNSMYLMTAYLSIYK